MWADEGDRVVATAVRLIEEANRKTRTDDEDDEGDERQMSG